MKIFVLCNTAQLGLPILHKLHTEGSIVGVGVMNRIYPQLLPSMLGMGIDESIIHPLAKENWIDTLESVLKELKADCVFVFTFSWKVPPRLLNLPPKGFINFHFGLLPKYKGADPIFWQMKNQESAGGLTVHVMTEEMDEGPVILREELPLNGGENYGLHCHQLAQVSRNWLDTVLERLTSDRSEYIELEPTEPANFEAPGETDLTIDWTKQSALEIECLINATNPRYEGARTTFNGQSIKILEVTPMDVTEDMKGEPGEIVYADLTYGPIVACADGEFVRITIANLGGAYISGVKLTNFGFLKGNKFI